MKCSLCSHYPVLLVLIWLEHKEAPTFRLMDEDIDLESPENEVKDAAREAVLWCVDHVPGVSDHVRGTLLQAGYGGVEALFYLMDNFVRILGPVCANACCRQWLCPCCER